MANVSPLLVKGAILVLEPNTGISLNTIHLQYNPETIKRTLQPQSIGDQPDRTEVLRLKGPPIETISCEVEIDATDQLAATDATTMSLGIAPQLSALELLVYPASALLIANEVLSLVGTIEILPMFSNLTVFSWGANRVTPVRLTGLEITEEMFDPQLNPIRAKVGLTMRVLNVNDVGFLSPAGALYMAYQIGKESMAQQG
jgi:Contractile injection system tube protein